MQLAVVVAALDIKVKSLEQHIAEFGITDAGLAVLHARAHALFRDHGIDGEVFADVAQKIEIPHLLCPGGVVEQARRIHRVLKIQPALQLLLLVGNVGREHFPGEQLAFGALAAGIADGAGRSSRQRDGMMTKQLETPQGE